MEKHKTKKSKTVVNKLASYKWYFRNALSTETLESILKDAFHDGIFVVTFLKNEFLEIRNYSFDGLSIFLHYITVNRGRSQTRK